MRMIQDIIPRARGICPSCFEEIDLRDCDIVSGITKKVLKKASRLRMAQFTLEPLEGPFYNREQAHRRCPRRECQYLLPYNIERVHNIALSVAGDVYSGKSHYIASLVHQLENEWQNTTSGSIQIKCLTEEIQKNFIQRYMTPLFSQKKRVDATQLAVHRNPQNPQPLVDHPLIYNIQVSRSYHHPPRSFNLLLYDTGGEDFREITRLVQFARFPLNSSAFIFVADPFSMDAVYKDLSPFLQSMVPSSLQPANRLPASRLVNQVLASFRRDSRTGDISRLTHIPIAVMVSKADIFTNAQGVQPSYPYRYHGFAQNYRPQYGFHLDRNDINMIDEEVENLLTHYQQTSLVHSTRRLGKSKLFATSATGAPQNQPDYFPSVTPWRCLDPLLWIFYELGFIKSL